MENTAGMKTGAGTASTVFSIALTEQQEAQALHLCLLASPTLAEAAATAGVTDSSSARAAVW